MSDRTDRGAGDGRRAEPEEDTNTHDLAAAEAALDAELLGVDPDDEPQPSEMDDGQDQDETHDPDAEASTSDEEPGDDADADDADATTDDGDDEDGDQSAEASSDDDDEDEVDERIPDNWHPSAKRRLRRALKDRRKFKDQLATYEQSHQAMQGLQAICQRHKMPNEQAPALLDLVGKALVGKDPASQRALLGGLQRAGLEMPKQEAPEAPKPAIDIDALAAAIDRAEDDFDFDRLKAMVAKAKERQSQQPAPEPTTEQPQANEPELPDAVRQHGRQSMQSELARQAVQRQAEMMDQVLATSFGEDEAKRLGQQIYTKAKRVMQGKPVELWADVLQITMDQVLALHTRATPKPPKTVRSSGKRNKPKSEIDRRLEAFERELTGG